MTGAIVATSIVFFPAAPFFLFMHGKDIAIPKGTEIAAYTNGEIALDQAKFTKPAPATPTLAEARPATTGKPLSNDDVLALRGVGLSDDLIVAKIKSAPANYTLNTDGLIALKKASLSEGVIAAMIEAQARAR